MACSLIEHKRVSTTVAKAKALQKYIEPLLTKSKTDSTHSRRTVFSYLKNKETITELFRDISVKIADRPGGYTRILKTGFRIGDNAQMCFIELVDYNENMLKDAKQKSGASRRRRSTKKTDAPSTPAAKTTGKVTEADTKAEVIEEPIAEIKVEAKNDEVKEDHSEEEKKED